MNNSEEQRIANLPAQSVPYRLWLIGQIAQGMVMGGHSDNPPQDGISDQAVRLADQIITRLAAERQPPR